MAHARTPDLTTTMSTDPTRPLPRVLADLPLAPALTRVLESHVELLPWESVGDAGVRRVEAIYTYGHPPVGAGLLDRLPGVRVISNFGVGVDHIDLAAAA